MTQRDEMKGVKLVQIAISLKLERPQWFFVVGRHIYFPPLIGWKSLYEATCDCDSLLVLKILLGSRTCLLLLWQSSAQEAASQPASDVNTKALFVPM